MQITNLALRRDRYGLPNRSRKAIIDALCAAHPLTTYTGMVATAVNTPLALNQNVRYFNSRSPHRKRGTCATVQVAFQNWVYDVITLTETGTTTTVTHTASLEYPEGTFKQFKWSGSATSPSIASGADGVLSDPLNWEHIPDGALFWINSHGVNAASGSSTRGIPVVSTGASDKANGARYNSSNTTNTDETMSGVTASASTNYVAPYAIVGDTTRPSFLIYGDSRPAGSALPEDDYTDASTNKGSIARQIGPYFAYGTCAKGSYRLDKFVSSHTNSVARATYASHILLDIGVNDLSASRTPAQLIADYQSFAGYFSPKSVRQLTIMPRVTGTFETLAGQTLWTKEADRLTVNDAIRGPIAGFGAHLDVCAVNESASAPGKWNPGHTSGGVHHSIKGAIAWARSRAINPVHFFGLTGDELALYEWLFGRAA